jgi:tetratricopeptide (TPR) repeat protein
MTTPESPPPGLAAVEAARPDPAAPPLPLPPPKPPVRGLDFVAGLPAVAAAAAVVAVFAATPSPKAVAKTYETEGVERVKRKDFPGALVCFKRLLGVAPERTDMRFVMALVLEQLGRPAEAEAIARSVAPIDRPGYPPANYWLAHRILADPARTAAQANQAEGHLLRFLQADPKSAEASALLGGLYAATGRPREARVRLEKVAGKEPDRLLDLANACQVLGDRDESLRHARAALQEARARAEARPDDRVSRLLWANASVFLQDYPAALETLERGNALAAGPVFRPAMARVCALWAGSLEAKGEAALPERLSIIERGLAYDASNSLLLTQLSSLMGAGGPTAEKARAAVRKLLAEGKAPAMAHFALGNDAWSRGNNAEARAHWEQAYQLEPRLTIVSNNLAWALAFREPADVTKAIALIDEAIARNPSDPRLRGTRGEILVKAGRWKEAVTELEFALSGGAGTAAVHDALALAYDNLGMAEMAAEHRKQTRP